MNCEVAQEQIVAAAYGDLPDELTHELEQHVASCVACRREREQVQALKVLAGAYPVQEPDANLMARARLRLDEALDELPPRGWYERLAQQVRNGFAGLQAAPVAAALLLVAGVSAGSFGGYRLAQHRAVPVAAPAPGPVLEGVVSGTDAQPVVAEQPALASVANVSAIARQPNSQMVEVRYNQLVPRQIRGSLQDPAIRQLLMVAVQNSASPAVRDRSVDLLAAECKTSRGCQPSGIRDTLMVALRYDKDTHVREKALEGLQPYVAQDMHVRDAVLEALLNDDDPGIRTAALNLLAPVEADTSVRQVLYSVSNTDENPQIRNVSRQILSQVPEIQ